nr:LysR family substrate-binding domain-containing protein [Tomitella biformata]
MPAKWVRTWSERIPGVPIELVSLATAAAVAATRGKEVDAGLVRLPIDRDELHAIPLYIETTVVVMPTDHVLSVSEELTFADLEGEVVLHPQDDPLRWGEDHSESLPGTPALERPATTQDAFDLVLAGIGVVIVPQSLARLHHHKDLTFRPLAEAPTSQVALVWREDSESNLMEDLIGIVRGRTANSSRGKPETPKERPTAKAKAKARAQSAPPAGRGKQGGGSGKANQRGPAKGGRPNGGKGGGKSGGKGRGR